LRLRRMERKNLGIILAILAAVVSGVSVYLNKFAASQTDAVLFSFAKNALVAVFLSLFLVNFAELKKVFSNRKNLPALSVVSLLGGGAAFILFFAGLKMTSAISANFIQKSMFLFVLPFSFLLLKKAPSGKQLGVAAALVKGNVLFWKLATVSFNLGDALILAAAAIWAAEAAVSEKLLSGISASTLTFVRFAGGLPVFFAYLLSKQTNWTLALNAPLWTFGLAGVLAVYSILYFSAIQRAGAFATTATLSIAPLVTILFSGAGMSLAQSVGAAAIVGATAFLAFSGTEAWKAKA
jgi:drug/metabolite transporter (DMT)-like permease